MDDLLRKWRFKFTWYKNFGAPRFDYSIVGARGGLNLHITDYGKEHAEKFGDRFSGGLEIHSRTPMYGNEAPPSHDKCWLLHCPCWHDGTSLYVSETIIPMWIGREHDFEFWHSFMAGEAEERFKGLRDRYGE